MRYGSAVVLYVCPSGTSFGGLPAPIAHPCGRAAKALNDAGHTYKLERVKGGSAKVWTWPSRARDRAEVERLSGQRAVPILVLDDGEVVSGSGAIASWAREHSAGSPAAAG
jgi:glutathione S-transferase